LSVWLTGDIHGDPTRFSKDSFYEQTEMNKDDYVIILGDFGLVWNREKENKNERYWLDWLQDKPFTTLFIDGNHENFDRLYSYPVEEWNGGKVHKIRPNVIHLMRGQVFELNGSKFFTFGGASSHDISDGILDYEDENWREKAKVLDKQGKYMYRIKGLSWWTDELSSEEEMENGIKNLEKHNWKVDYILTHSPSASVIALLGKGLYEQDVLTKYLEDIRCKTEYKRMFSGHMHINKAVNDKDILLYEQIVRVV
jgi:predicted phosphodiesterase